MGAGSGHSYGSVVGWAKSPAAADEWHADRARLCPRGQPADLVLIGPAHIANRAEIDQADFELVGSLLGAAPALIRAVRLRCCEARSCGAFSGMVALLRADAVDPGRATTRV